MKAARLAAALPELRQRGQADTEHSSLPVMERASRSGAGSALHASLRKRREACKKGEHTLGVSLPCEQVW